ncbi:MAG: hypothetical protein LAT65_07130 [Saccharospirillum sp.]|nr:hypothetical protein [Saccharospirillum sp.]
MIRTKALIIACLLGLPAFVWGSALFDDRAANFWLVDTVDGKVTSYSAGDWVLDYDQLTNPPALSGPHQTLVNSLPKSSVSMSAGQPGVSVIGLAEADRILGEDSGPKPLRVLPADGYYTETLAIRLQVDDSLSGHYILRWRFNEGSWISETLTPQSFDEVSGGYLERVHYLVHDGDYDLEVELRSNIGVLVDDVVREYKLYSTHEDGHRRDTSGDGIPDLVKIAMGLSPLSADDGEPGSDGNWSRFDLWLRCAEIEFDEEVCVEPEDRDKDGWSDFDEELRGTRPDDPATLTFIDGPEEGSVEHQNERQRFKEYPAARRLYEVEYRLDGTNLGMPVDTLSATTLYGDIAWDPERLVTPTDLDNAQLSEIDVAASRLRELADKALDENQWPAMRLPAGVRTLVRASRVVAVGDSTARQVFLLTLPIQPDLTPRLFSTVADEWVGDWDTVEEWRAGYLKWLRETLVQDIRPEFDADQSLVLLVLEQLLAQEARLRGIGGLERLGQPGARLRWVREFNTTLAERHEGHNITAVIEQLEKALLDDGLLKDDARTIQTWLEDTPEGLDSSAWLRQKLDFNQAGRDLGCFVSDDDWARLNEEGNEVLLDQFLTDCPTHYLGSELLQWQTESLDLRYRLRLMLLAEGLMRLGHDNSLASAAADSDEDGLTNADEIMRRPYRWHTLPWLADTDGDGLIDSVDRCPLDPLNGCTGTPDGNQLYLGSDLTLSKPYQMGMVLLSIELDRPALEAIRVSYQVLANDGDSAIDGEDFIASSGEVWLQPGQSAVLIPVTLLNEGEGSTFRLQVTEVEGASLAGSDSTLVTLTPYEPSEPRAVLLASNLVVHENESITLDASASYDPDGRPLSFVWQPVSGPDVVLSNSENAITELTAPELLADTSALLEVTVSNDAGLTNSAELSLLITAEDDPPIVLATPQFNKERGAELYINFAELEAYIEDPEQQPLSFFLRPNQPLGARVSESGSGLLVDGGIAEAVLLAPEEPSQFSAVPWGQGGVAFISRDATGHHSVWVWHYSFGLMLIHSTEHDIDNLMANPASDSLYFDETIADKTVLNWLSPGNSVQKWSTDGLPEGTDARLASPFTEDLYFCRDNMTWSYLDVKTGNQVNSEYPCSGEAAKVIANKQQVCLVSDDLLCTEPGSMSSEVSNWLSLDGATMRGLHAFGELTVVMADYGTEYGFYALSPTEPMQAVAFHYVDSADVSSAELAYTLNTSGDVLLGLLLVDGGYDVIRWEPGDNDATLLASGLLAGVPQEADSPKPLIEMNGQYYWLADVGVDRWAVQRIDPESGSVQTLNELTVGSYGVESIQGYQLVSSPRGLVLSGQYGDGLCFWQRLDGSGVLRSVHFDDVLCEQSVTASSIELHRKGERYYHIQGGDFLGSTGFSVDVSDGVNEVELPIKLIIEEAD